MSKVIFDQIKYKTEVDEEKDHVTIRFPSLDLVYKFPVNRGVITIEHKSHAAIATVTGKRVRYRGDDIEATNRVFDWLGIKYTVDYTRTSMKGISNLKDGVISFF